MCIDVADHNAGIRAALAQDLAPGRNDKAMPECFAAIFVPPALRSRQNERLGFDGARPEERMPMRFAGDPRKGCGSGNERSSGLGKSTVQRRETQDAALLQFACRKPAGTSRSW